MNSLSYRKPNGYKNFVFVLGLVLTLSANNIAFSGDKPLSTIGEPQLNHPSTQKASPFTSSQNPNSPFTTDQQIQNNDPANNSLNTEEQKPQIEEIKTSEQRVPSLVANPSNKLGLAYPYQQLEKSTEMLKAKDLAGAKKLVEPLSEWLTSATEFHIQLFKKLNDIESAKNQAQVEKRLALDSALLRDKAYYQLALIYLAENKNKEAIKYFIEVIKSQPKTELGMKSYEILQQIGFTEKVRLVP